ncbi:unnamed protein product, partial [Iphiclides podalirius]
MQKVAVITMGCHRSTVIILSVIYFGSYVLAFETNSRQKRCIVVQKQSGTHGDSSEGGGDEEGAPEPRDSRSDRRVLDPLANVRDVEELPPNLLKYRISPAKRYSSDWHHYMNRIYKNHI